MINKIPNVTLMAVGDIMLGDHPICLGHGVGSKIKKMGPKFPFLYVASILHEADIVFGNLEAVISGAEINTKSLKSLQLKALPEVVEGLKYAGFNILSLANNHILEHGNEAMFETLDILSKCGINSAGVNKTSKKQPLIFEKNKIKIAFLAYCLIRDKTAYCSVDDYDEICTDVTNCKKNADIVIVSLHWGNEFIRKPSLNQIKIAHDIIDAGATLILGHHPHVLQGIEYYKKGIIAYSLGNFIFDMWQKRMRESMIFCCDISKNGVVDVKTIPIYINKAHQPEIAQDNCAKKILSVIHKPIKMDSDDGYFREVALRRKQYRQDVKKHFITNFFRYHPRIALQLITKSLEKRFGAIL